MVNAGRCVELALNAELLSDARWLVDKYSQEVPPFVLSAVALSGVSRIVTKHHVVATPVHRMRRRRQQRAVLASAVIHNCNYVESARTRHLHDPRDKRFDSRSVHRFAARHRRRSKIGRLGISRTSTETFDRTSTYGINNVYVTTLLSRVFVVSDCPMPNTPRVAPRAQSSRVILKIESVDYVSIVEFVPR